MFLARLILLIKITSALRIVNRQECKVSEVLDRLQVYYVTKSSPTNLTIYKQYVDSLKDGNEPALKSTEGKYHPMKDYKLKYLPRGSKHVILLFGEISALNGCNMRQIYKIPSRNLRIGNLKPVYTSMTDKYGYIYMLSENLERDYVVLSIRGTKTISDWMDNLNSEPVSTTKDFKNAPKNARVHKGHLRLFQKYKGGILHVLHEYCYGDHYETRSKNLYIVGQSLGGSLAFLISVYLKSNEKTLKLFKKCKLEGVYTFNSPKIGNLAFSNYGVDVIGKTRFFRVVNDNDLVPHLGVDYGEHPTTAPEYFFDRNHNLKVCNYTGGGFCSSQYKCSQTQIFSHRYVGDIYISKAFCGVTKPVPEEVYMNKNEIS